MQINRDNSEVSVVFPKNWSQAALGIAMLFSLVLWVYWQTWHSMIAIWLSSDTFAHGFLVLPFSAWFIWYRRHYFLHLTPVPAWKSLLTAVASGFLWLTADLVHAQVIAQWAAVMLLISCIWGVVGDRVTAQLLFPLGFLLFMVPFGEAFVPSLMEFTANFTVWLLQLTGIPVYREGLYFTLTTGSWSVVQACSGIRYLIASFSLGVIFAYLNYVSYRKRLLFILLSLLVPILANGLRAYLIVMLGHVSDMQLATGVDHLIYGWLFFGVVILLLFYAGSFWRDELVKPEVPAIQPKVEPENKENLKKNSVLLLLMLSVTPWPILSHYLSAQQAAQSNGPLPERMGDWVSTTPPEWQWQPHFHGVARDTLHYFASNDHVIGFYQASFGNESQGVELVNSQHGLIDQKDKTWRIVKSGSMLLSGEDGKEFVTADQFVLRSETTDLGVLQWYRIGHWYTANAYQAKLLQLLKRLTGNVEPELLVVLFTKGDKHDGAVVWTTLQTWMNAFRSAVAD